MKKFPLIVAALCLVGTTLVPVQSEASGFNRLKAAGSGLDKGGSSGGAEGGSDGSGGETAAPTSPSDLLVSTAEVILIGQYKTYLPDRRVNARLTIFGKPSDFKYADWACRQKVRLDDSILTYFYQNPPKSDSRGQVETASMNAPVQDVIFKALRTKYNPFNEIFVINGRYSNLNPPKELEGYQVAGCDDVSKISRELKNMEK